MAFMITFSRYNEELDDLGEWFNGAVVASFIKIFTVMSQLPFNTGGEDIFAKDVTPVGQRSVALSSGAVIQGSVNHFTTTFHNIRYAQSPVGDLRFSDPVPYDQPNFVDASTRRRWICPQECTPPFCQGEITEDCLYLTINIPSSYNNGANKLPVMVWIHGGGFFQGAGNDKIYDAERLSNLTGTIVVTLNYRLGWLGFLPYDKEGISGNQGIKDQRMAMKWVYDNIEAFGGDNNQITLFGESAGAQSVLFHLVSEESSPYYQRAILQSTFAYPYQNRQEWNKVADLVLTQFKLRFKCNMLSGLDCLRKIPFEEYLQLNNMTSNIAKALAGARTHFAPLATESQFPIYLESSTPLIDGDSSPLALLKSGQWATDKDVIIGHTDGEVDSFNYMMPPLDRDTAEEKAQLMHGEYLGSAALAAYEGFVENDYGQIFGEMMTHSQYACYAQAIAKAMSMTGSGKIFFYEFAQPYQVRDPATGELIYKTAQHAGELQYLFRNKLFDQYQGTVGDKQVMEMLSDYWGSFATDGFPHSDRYFSWPQYNDQANGDMNILKISQPDATVKSSEINDHCAFWDVSGVWIRS